jgi:hypothetical protein
VRIFVVSAFALALLTGAAHAQYQPRAGENANTEADRADAEARRAAEEDKKQREIDKAYKATVGQTQTKAPAPPRDPWANMR